MKLYHATLSTYSQKVLLACREKGIEPELVAIDLADDEARRRYREIYPLGKVPLLMADDGHRVPESSIIIEYLDARFDGGPRLIPAAAEASRQARFHDRMMDLYLNESIGNLIFQSWRPESERDPQLIERCRFRIGVIYDFMEGALAQREWLNGDTFSIADCAAAPALNYARMVAPFAGRPHIESYWERLSARPAWQSLMRELGPDLAGFRAEAV